MALTFKPDLGCNKVNQKAKQPSQSHFIYKLQSRHKHRFNCFTWPT